jgi:predicted enzyme related to lactoylglutathione lyase
MGTALPAIPAGSGQHPVVLVVIAAGDLARTTAFYRDVFGWPSMVMGPDLAAGTPSSGPGVAFRANQPEGAQAAVPMLHVPDVADTLARLVAAGATLDRSPFSLPGVGTMARVRDPSGTVWGLTDSGTASPPPVPMPFGDNPRPPAHSICSLEMYATPDDTTPAWFATHFGWGVAPTMPQFIGFDPGAGIGGVFQSHTPAAPVMVYVYVDDVAATLAAIEAAGGRRLADPMAMPGMGTFGYFTDVSGTAMGLIGP